MKKTCPHCGEAYEDDAPGMEESAAHEASPGDSEEDFGERIAKAVVKELKGNDKRRSSFEDDEEKWPA